MGTVLTRTAQEFKDAAKKIKPKKWIIHECSLCGYPCGYVFSPEYKRVGYDSGCNCVTYENIQERSWEDLASYYNCQENKEYIDEMNKFWGFEVTEYQDDEDLWFFQFIDSDNIWPLEFDDIILCSEKSKYLDSYSKNHSIIGRSKNEVIDKLIKRLNEMK